MGHPLEESQINMLTLVALAFVAAVSADSVRYQVSTTPISYEKDLQSFNAGAARLVTLNLEEEKCDAPTIEQPCGWGLHRTVYAPVDGKTYMSGGQRNAFGLNKADNVEGFWSNAELATEDLPGDLITLEKDLRVEYGVAPLRQKSAKKLVNGIHTGSSPSYVAGNVDLNAGANVGACFRLFDSEPAARPNSFDLVATGEPEGVEGNAVFGFWREGVVGEMSTADVAAFYASNDVAPAVEPRDADLRAAQAVLGARAKLGLDGVEQRFAQPVFGAEGAEIANDEEGVAGFVQDADVAERRAAIFPLVYNSANDRVHQACVVDGDVCVFRPVAYASATACGNTRSRSAIKNYFN